MGSDAGTQKPSKAAKKASDYIRGRANDFRNEAKISRAGGRDGDAKSWDRMAAGADEIANDLDKGGSSAKDGGQ